MTAALYAAVADVRTTGWYEQTVDRLSALTPDYPHAYTVEVHSATTDAGWLSLAEAPASLYREAVAEAPVAAASARVAGSLAHAVAGRMTAAIVLDRRSPAVPLNHTLVRTDGAGYLDRVAVAGVRVAVLPADPAAASPQVTVVADLPALLDVSARIMVETLTPLFADLRTRSRFGLVPMWNSVGDAVLSCATWLPFLAGQDQRAGRDVGERLLDAVVAHGAPIRRRGRVQPLPRARTTFLAPVRATCCLHYKTQPSATPACEAFCTTCPHVSDGDRANRYRTYLDENHPEPA